MSITLKNDKLTVTIEEAGAQLCSVLAADGTEYIWQADPEIWGRHAPLLFPVIGRLQGGRYTVDGETYEIPAHGFARDLRFTVLEKSETSVRLRLTDSPETLDLWPFSFILTVTYTLNGGSLTKTCHVQNPNSRPMLYELGCHDGFRAPLAPGETMSDYAVVIPGVEELTPYGMDEACMITPKRASFPLTDGRISLKPYDYQLDTVILDELPRNTAMLVDKSGRARVTLDFPGFSYLGIWTQNKPYDTNYVCIEPWSTLPDAVFAGRALADKPGIRVLAPSAGESLTYTTTFD